MIESDTFALSHMLHSFIEHPLAPQDNSEHEGVSGMVQKPAIMT